MSDPRARIPSVDRLLDAPALVELVASHGRGRVVDAIRSAIDEVRRRLVDVGGEDGQGLATRVSDPELYGELAAAFLRAEDVPSLRRVINATGVVLHTNLGRAPLPDAAIEAMGAVAGYSNLEYDLDEGERGSRYTHCVSLLTALTGAEAALVVNNAAAGLVLALNTAGRDRGVAVSRGELVEIGGGFRIPEVLERAGARLVEVGSTNRTRVADYSKALAEGGASAILKVHRSNFRMSGFTEEASLPELSSLARERDVPLIHDLGSGLMLDAARLGLPDEPTPARSIEAGVDAVVVSGDKLLGGPQAGLVMGRREPIGRMRANPLCRALRVDKVTLAGLEATLRFYRDPERALVQIPTLRMLAESESSLQARADALCARLAAEGIQGDVVEASGAVGGGTFPGVELPSRALALRHDAPDHLARRLRAGEPPVVARILDDALLLDVRTVLPGQDDDLVRRVVEASSSQP
jgi:L-seryl-tRNA(Ser) seleniumtransferase